MVWVIFGATAALAETDENPVPFSRSQAPENAGVARETETENATIRSMFKRQPFRGLNMLKEV
jgi:hypothetical protein